MRKLFICFVISMFAFVVNAQKHLSFMGFPLNGSITSFQQKLATKSILPYKEFNATNPVGIKAFKGSFSGYESDVYVYFNEKSRNVYRAKACISNGQEDIVLDRYDEFKKLLCEKYKSCKYIEGSQNGYFSFCIFVRSENNEENIMGEIAVYISSHELLVGVNQYVLHIDYIDWANKNKNKAEKMSDL